MDNKNTILNALILAFTGLLTIATVSGCGFIEEIKHPSSFPKDYLSSYKNVDEIIKDAPLTEGENIRITDVAETRTSIVRLIQVRKDSEIEAHAHENHDEVVYQVKGSGIAVLSGKQHPVKPGTVLLVPRGTPHSFVNNGTEDSIALSFFSPPLESSPTEFPDEEDALRFTTSPGADLPIVQNLNEISKEIPTGEVVKTIELGKSQDASIQLGMVRKDAEIRQHYHKRNDEVIYGVKGRGIIILNGTRYVVKPGSVMIVPRKSYHKFINTGDEPYVALSLFSPPFTGKGTKYIRGKEIRVRERASGVRPIGEPLRE